MNRNTPKNFVVRNVFLCAAAIVITSCGTATFTKTGSDATIESLRNFELAFIDEFAVPGKKFNAAAFNAKVNEGNAKFQQAIADEKFKARLPVLVDLKAQFDADAAHLKSKASRGKITPALASEMKKDVKKTNPSQKRTRNFRICSGKKRDTSKLVRQNAEELGRRLVLLKNREIDNEDFDHFIENQKRDLRVYVDGQPAQAQERAEKLT